MKRKLAKVFALTLQSVLNRRMVLLGLCSRSETRVPPGWHGPPVHPAAWLGTADRLFSGVVAAVRASQPEGVTGFETLTPPDSVGSGELTVGLAPTSSYM